MIGMAEPMRDYSSSMEDSTVRIAASCRAEIDAAVAAAGRHSLGTVLSMDGVGYAYLSVVLAAHPCMGKVKGRRTMVRLGFGPRVRVGELSTAGIALLEDECECPHG